MAELSGVVQKIERIAQSLEAGEITDKQAAARLSDLSQELAEHRRQLGKDKPMPALSGDPN